MIRLGKASVLSAEFFEGSIRGLSFRPPLGSCVFDCE